MRITGISLAVILAAGCIATITSCSGYSADYQEQDPYADLWDEESSSSYSSSYSRSSSSSYSSSSWEWDYYSDDTEDIVTVLDSSDFDLTEKCANGLLVSTGTDSTTYRCSHNRWFEEVRTLPDSCTAAEEMKEVYKNAPYVCKAGEWVQLTTEEAAFGLCTKSLQGTTFTEDSSVYFTCDSLTWRLATDLESLGECTDSVATQLRKMKDTSYVCRNKKWQVADTIEASWGLCTASRAGDTAYIHPTLICPMGVDCYGSQDVYYVCKNNRWTKTTDLDEILGKCDSLRETDMEKAYQAYKVCQNGKWRNATENESLIRKACTESLQDSVYAQSTQSHFICDKGDWRPATPEEYYGKCSEELQDVIYYDSTNYICNGSLWSELPDPPLSSMDYCTKKNAGSMYRTTTTPRAYYHCQDYVWQKIDSLSYTYGICSKDSLGVRKIPHKDSLGYECKETAAGYSWTRLSINDYAACTAATQDSLLKGFVCDNGTWRLQTALEKSIGLCTTKNNGERKKSGTSYYECSSGSWKAITEEQYSLGECTTENDSAIAVYKNVQYLCANQKWITPNEENYIATCPSAVAGWLVSYKNRIHQCTPADGDPANGNYAWRYIGDIAIQEGLCRAQNQGKVALLDSTYYICKTNWWSIASLDEIAQATSCSETFIYNHIKFTCSGDEWTPVYETVKDSRDGQSYKALQLGEQTWMVENLNYKTTNSWCFQNIDRNCDTYGRLYTWNAAQTACPTGWHLPDAYEYRDMLKSLKSTEIRDSEYWQENSYGYRGETSLFKLRGTGIRTDNGSFDYDRRMAGLWYKDSSLTNADTAYGYINVVTSAVPYEYYSSSYYHHFEISGNTVVAGSPSGYRFIKGTGLNVRCVKDSK